MARAILTSKAEPGLILGKDACNLQGTLLLREGQRLTEKNLRMLKAWGVHKIWVEEASPGEPDGSPASVPEDSNLEAELTKRFEGVLDHPVMAEIYQIVLKHRRELVS